MLEINPLAETPEGKVSGWEAPLRVEDVTPRSPLGVRTKPLSPLARVAHTPPPPPPPPLLQVFVCDAKINFDDNATFRQAAIFAKRDFSQEDPREVEASKWDLNYIGAGMARCSRRARAVSAYGARTLVCAGLEAHPPSSPPLLWPRRQHRVHGERRGARDGDDGHHQAPRRQPRQLP